MPTQTQIAGLPTLALSITRTDLRLIGAVFTALVLGVLVSVFVIRTAPLNDEHVVARHASLGNALSTSVSLVKYHWTVNGHSHAVDNIRGFGRNTIDTNGAGYPVATDDSNGNPTTQRCIQLWEALLPYPPSISRLHKPADTDYQVWTGNSGWCHFRPAQHAGLRISYHAPSGQVSVDQTF